MTKAPRPVLRYAHPYFDAPDAQNDAQLAAAGRLPDWSKENLGPLPPIKNGGKFDLKDVIGAAGVNEIIQTGELRFHAVGDTGVGHADAAQEVAEEMASDFTPGAGGLNPAFLLHLGDIIYGNDKSNHYGERFYSPYRHYPGKVIAIPGNHDGEVRSNPDNPSLKAFMENFCADKAAVPDQAKSAGIYRETMTQPGAYWLLETPFARIIGLYSNRLENPGWLEGKKDDGTVDKAQLEWLETVLTDIKAAPRKGLIFAAHHPPYSAGGHRGSTGMNAGIDGICERAGVWPDAFLSGHAHNYQLYTRRIGGKSVPYIVAGTGGMPPQPVPQATGQPVARTPGVTFDKSLRSLGYIFATLTAKRLKFEFWQYGSEHASAFDSVTVDIA